MDACSDAWEALRGDPLPWLLDASRPNLHWRVLLDLVRRPPQSPAVVRARGGANAVQPVASLIADLSPDGTWETASPLWRTYSGPGWRFLAAIQWGADPTDPRLQAAADVILETAPGSGGFALVEGERPVPWLTARLLNGLAELGWRHHHRFQEGLAWLEEGGDRHVDGGWRRPGPRAASRECAITPVALLAALAACRDDKRLVLRERAAESLFRIVASRGGVSGACGHPCLGRTDEAELVWSLAISAIPLQAAVVPVLQRLQRRQAEGGRWRRGAGVPPSLGVHDSGSAGAPSRWVTMKCVVGLMAYAVAAGLPRLFPKKPT